MGRFFTKKMLLVLTSILLLHLLITSSYSASFNSNETGICISEAGRFHQYESEGKIPESAYLELCKMFHGKTCCSASQLNSVSLSLGNLSSYGEAVKDCLDLFYERVFEACSEAYFTSDPVNQSRVDQVKISYAVKLQNGCVIAQSSANQLVLLFKKLMISVESVDNTEKLSWFQGLKKVVKKMSSAEKTCWVITFFGIGTNTFLRLRYEQLRMQAKIERDMRRFIRNMNRFR